MENQYSIHFFVQDPLKDSIDLFKLVSFYNIYTISPHQNGLKGTWTKPDLTGQVGLSLY